MLQALQNRPPEEVCKPDSVLPPRTRKQQPFIWPPGCPGDRATDPRERTGHPRPAEAGPPSYAVLLRVGFTERPPSRAGLASSYLAVSPLLRTRGVRGGLLSVALSPDRSGPSLAATLPCGVRTFLPPRRGGRLLDLLRRTRSRYLLASSPSDRQKRIRWQLGQRITLWLRWISLKSWGGTRIRQP